MGSGDKLRYNFCSARAVSVLLKSALVKFKWWTMITMGNVVVILERTIVFRAGKRGV